MGDQQNISQILAALAAVRPGGLGGLPSSTFPGNNPNQTPTADATGYALPQPDSTGSLNISGANPVNSGSVSIADAIAKARGIAAEKGIPYSPNQGQQRGTDSRSYRRSRSPSRTPPRPAREVFRDGYNPYRDERRTNRRGGGDRGYERERSFSPRPAGRGRDAYSPPGRQFRPDRSPQGRRTGGGPGSGAGGGGGGADENSETINIDSKLVGMIIGRQGDNLRRIESDSGARVQFLDSPEFNKAIRLCRISGAKTARENAKVEINRVISENSASRPGFRGSERPPHQAQDVGSGQPGGDGDGAMQIMVPDRTVGLIIGRAGETIRDLQERSGCHVNIEGDGKSVSGLRPVNLSGPAHAMQNAKELILEIVESDSRQPASAPQRDPRGHPDMGPTGDKINDTLYIPKESVGMIIGKGGDTIKEIQSVTNCKINILPPVGRDPDREVTLLGTQSAIDEAKKVILEKVDAYKIRAQAPRRDDGNDRYGQYQQQPQHHQQQQQSFAQDPAPQPQQPSAQQGGAEGGDPYAMYGGYDNYVAMWYAAMAQQQQQQQPQQQQQSPYQQQQQGGVGGPPPSGPDQPGPPGVS